LDTFFEHALWGCIALYARHGPNPAAVSKSQRAPQGKAAAG
jgi:hypothetical protein